jgi:hypothetical protein
VQLGRRSIADRWNFRRRPMRRPWVQPPEGGYDFMVGLTPRYSRTCRLEMGPPGRLVGAGFSRLLHYVKCHGNARVPVSYMVDGYPLGHWVNTQRSFYAKGTLDADRQYRLQDLTGWTWKASSSTWASGLAGRSSSIMTRRQRPATW